MEKLNVPKIEPTKVKEFTSKQSKYDVVGKLPLRDIILGPSGAGKGILISNMILKIYKGCSDRIYLFSPSIDVDKTWLPVKEYIEKSMKLDPKKEAIYFDHYDPEALEHIISTQHKVAEHMKQQLRNAGDLDAWVDEVSAITDKKTLFELYHLATSKPYSFLFIKLNSKDTQHMFYIRFDERLTFE